MLEEQHKKIDKKVIKLVETGCVTQARNLCNKIRQTATGGRACSATASGEGVARETIRYRTVRFVLLVHW